MTEPIHPDDPHRIVLLWLVGGDKWAGATMAADIHKRKATIDQGRAAQKARAMRGFQLLGNSHAANPARPRLVGATKHGRGRPTGWTRTIPNPTIGSSDVGMAC
jgi:hypothetical protein